MNPFWAAALAAAQALVGCGGAGATAAIDAAVAPGEQGAAGPGGIERAAIPPVEEFAERVDPSRAPPPVTSDSPSRGPLGAPVTIRVFSDFECPFCGQAAPVLRDIEAEFGGNVRTVWYNFPLPGHPHAELAAVAGALVYRKGGGAAFWRYHDDVFKAARSGLDERVIAGLAAREGVDAASIDRALADGAGGRISSDLSTGDSVGVQGTPAFVVNDWMVTGVLPYPLFRALVVRALEEARATSKASTPR
jgi:protein-disulfide isomerase